MIEEPVADPVPELAEVVAEPDDGAIIPNPHGPLMVRKKPAHSWDFRDLLSAEPVSNEPEGGAGLPQSLWREVEQDAGSGAPRPRNPEFEAKCDLSPAAPVVEAEPIAATPAPRRQVEPGFTSFEIDLDIESRLKALIAAQTLTPEPLPEFAPEPERQAQAEPKVAQPDPGPAWPLGIGWLEDAPEPQTVRPSMLSRLLNLLPWRR